MPDPTTPTWRLVPVEPTPEMLAAMHKAGSMTKGITWEIDAYRAMLAAAPAPQELPPVQLPELPPVEPGMCLVCDIQDYAEAYARAAIAADRRAGGR